MRRVAVGVFLSAIAGALADGAPAIAAAPDCPAEMARVEGFCIDRWEIATIDRASGESLSPYYPPEPRLMRETLSTWQSERWLLGDAAARAMPLPELPARQLGARFEPKAVSRPGVVPQAYLSFDLARRACQNAGKRLCSQKEWVRACRGSSDTRHPYGGDYVRGRCNVQRLLHPAHELHGSSAVGHRDPRLNLVFEAGQDPLLRTTGASPGCVSRWGASELFDMVGNLDEWVDDDGKAVFVGGFYARATTKGCAAEVRSHAASYLDYSLGTRCCKDRR
jgi:hypothetical protein